MSFDQTPEVTLSLIANKIVMLTDVNLVNASGVQEAAMMAVDALIDRYLEYCRNDLSLQRQVNP